jgi:hypothetical protein
MNALKLKNKLFLKNIPNASKSPGFGNKIKELLNNLKTVLIINKGTVFFCFLKSDLLEKKILLIKLHSNYLIIK